jgi:hypothetical protein
MKITIVMIGICLSCSSSLHVAISALVVDDCSGPDDSTMVQAAMASGTCLASGAYHVDMPPLFSNGRRRDWSLSGGVLCGTRSSTIVFMRGDAHGLFWVGVLDPARVEEVQLDRHCVYNTTEQSHLIRLTTSNHVIRNATLASPRGSTPAGDSINIAGSASTPATGIVVEHVKFASCSRFAIQISRGVLGGQVINNSFGDGCNIGSEGAVAVDGLVIAYNTFTSSTPGLALNLQGMSNLLVSHNDLRGRTILLFHCDHCRVEHSSVSGLTAVAQGSFNSAVTVSDVAHDITLLDVQLTQHGGIASPVVYVGPLRANHQADLSDIRIIDSRLTQSTASPVIYAEGVTRLQVRLNDLTYDGPVEYVGTSLVAGPSIAVAPAVSVPSTEVIESDNVLVGLSH